MDDEIVIRLGSFGAVFLIMAPGEVLAPRRKLLLPFRGLAGGYAINRRAWDSASTTSSPEGGE